ncbi:TPA: hypothetical protein ACS3GD_001628 [Legionella pneumophila]
MNLSLLTNQILLGLSSMCLMSTVQAQIPVWSFSPNGSPVVTVSATGVATVSYTVRNNSQKPHRLVLSSKTPTGISQPGGPCVLAAKSPANPNPTCTLTLSINGGALPANNLSGGPSLCQTNPNGTPNANQCYQPDPNDVLVITRTTAPGATTLSTSIPPPSILALSVNDTALNAALTGNARYITIQNTGTNPASGVSVSATGLPAGTNITTVPTTCTGTLAPSATCTVTITPGSNATSSCNTGIAPTPGIITVSATNVATPATSNVVVLSYGCQYQDGFVYSVDDTTNNGVTGTCITPPCTKSIGGKVASLTDQAAPYINSSTSPGPGIAWDADPACATNPYNCSFQTNAWDFYIGLNLASVPGSTNPNNTGTNGPGNTYQISSVLNGNNGDTNGPPATYAAGVCISDTDGTHTDWYLPAICEMGPASNGSNCTAGTQNMVDNLSFLLGDPGNATPSTSCTPPSGTKCLAGYYWGSTEFSGFPLVLAWVQIFRSVAAGGSYQGADYKFLKGGVRCSRALTP